MGMLTITRPIALFVRFMQWSSAVIVMGITASFIHNWPKGQHIIYQQVISAMSVAFFLPAFVSPFMPNRLSILVMPIDVIFSYLWLTAFIFAAQDYNWRNCLLNAPVGAPCSRKKANEAFMFLAFLFTVLGIFTEIINLWYYRKEHDTDAIRERKYHGGPTNGSHTNGGGHVDGGQQQDIHPGAQTA